MTSVREVTCIPLWDGLLVPLQGDLSDAHADAVVAETSEAQHRALGRARSSSI